VYDCWQTQKYPRVVQRDLKKGLAYWEEKFKSGKISKDMYEFQRRFVELSFGIPSKIRSMPTEEVAKVASMMNSLDDLYGDTFMGRLFFISIALQNPQSAIMLHIYRRGAIDAITRARSLSEKNMERI